MKKGQLQKLFFDYLNNNPKEATQQQGGLLYSQEYFNINVKNNTIYVEGFGLVTRSEPFDKDFKTPDWIGFYQEDLSTAGFEDYKFILGYDSPFSVQLVLCLIVIF
jgi:hypothetical protein